MENRRNKLQLHSLIFALGAAALVLITLIVLYLCAGIQPMVQEASASLAVQYHSVESGAMIRAGILAAALAAGCIICLTVSGKNREMT